MSGDSDEAVVAKNEEWLDFLYRATVETLALNGLDMSRCSVSLVIQYAVSDSDPDGSLAYVGEVTAARMQRGAQRWVQEAQNCESTAKSTLARIMEKRL